MRIQYLSCLLLFVLVVGCGTSGPKLSPVSGRVTLDGQPLENADISFQPDGEQPPSAARTDKNGRYELGFKRGVLGGIVGEHTVRITISPDVVENPPEIPVRYNTESELRKEVKSGPNEINFELTSAEN